MNTILKPTYLATTVSQESILQIIQKVINFLIIVGIALAVAAAILALVISLTAGQQTKDTWYSRCKGAFVVGVFIALIPGAFKLVLGWIGAGDKYKLEGLGKEVVTQLTISVSSVFDKFIG